MRRAVLLALSVPLVFAAACSRQAPAPQAARAVKTLTVQAASTGATIDYAAEIRARSESRLGFRVGGKLVRRAVDVGDAVRAGQLLASLDPQDLRLSQEAAHSALEAARINADQAAADFKRFKELREQGFISLAELERRESAYKAAQAQFEQARAQAGVQSNQTRYSNLVSDVAGVVTVVEAEPGAVLAAGATVLRLAHEGPRDAVFSVPEQQVAAIRALLGRNGALKMRLWGDAAASIPATVREVAAAADPATRTFTVKADVGRAAVRLGQTATVSLPVPPSSGAFRLPLTAVFEQQGQAAVWLLDPASMTVQPQRIEVIGAEGNAVLVASGLTAGQTVVTAGAHTLTPGQKVTLYLEPGSAATAGPASTVQR